LYCPGPLEREYSSPYATDAFEQTIELAPDFADGDPALALLLQIDYNLKRSAHEAIITALELDPHYTKPHYFISLCHYWLGNSETALQKMEW